jgi:hypothetical protein
MIHLQVSLTFMMDEGECKMTEAAFVRLIASLNAAADAPEGRRSDAGRWPTRIRLTSRRLPASDAEDFWAI